MLNAYARSYHLSDSVMVDATQTSSRSVWTPWLVCLSAGLFFLYEFFQLNLFDVINQSLRQAFHLDAAQLSWMSSMYIWANVLFLLPAGVILDKLCARVVILFAMGICVVGTVGFGATHSFAWAAFFHALTGLGNAFCFLSCVILVSRWFPPRRQALVIGCVVTMAFLGGMLAHTPLVYLSHHYGWRGAVWIDAGIGCCIFLWILWVVKDNPQTQAISSESLEKQPYFVGVLRVLANRQNWCAGLYTACLNLSIMVLCALWGASFLQKVHHLDELTASNVVSLIFIGSMMGCPLVGWLSDSLGRRKPLMLVGAFATLVIVCVLLCDTVLSAGVLSALFFLLGLFTSTQVIAYPLIAESNSMHNTGVATGIASVIIMGGGGLGQILFGVLMRQHAGTQQVQYTAADFQFAMWMFPIATVIALVCVLLLRETYCERLSSIKEM